MVQIGVFATALLALAGQSLADCPNGNPSGSQNSACQAFCNDQVKSGFTNPNDRLTLCFAPYNNGGQQQCEGPCVDCPGAPFYSGSNTLQDDPNNCGKCLNKCGVGSNSGKPFCSAGQCVACTPTQGCTLPQICSNGVCVTPPTACANPLQKFPDCKECINNKLTFPACIACTNGGTAPDCVPPPTACANPLQKFPDCKECINNKLTFPACTACTNGGTAPECVPPTCHCDATGEVCNEAGTCVCDRTKGYKKVMGKCVCKVEGFKDCYGKCVKVLGDDNENCGDCNKKCYPDHDEYEYKNNAKEHKKKKGGKCKAMKPSAKYSKRSPLVAEPEYKGTLGTCVAGVCTTPKYAPMHDTK